MNAHSNTTGFVRIGSSHQSCCSWEHDWLDAYRGTGRLIGRMSNQPLESLNMCLSKCRTTHACAFVTHVVSVGATAGASATAGECRLCALCQLRTEASEHKFISYAHDVKRVVQAPMSILSKVLNTSTLDGEYSRRLYGAENRAPRLSELRILWTDLLTWQAQEALSDVELCSRAGPAPLRPFFASPFGSNVLWVHQPIFRAVPSHSWVEIAHCPLGSRTDWQCWPWKLSPMWAYVAAGSGVSINVGNTFVAESYAELAAVLQRLFGVGRLRRQSGVVDDEDRICASAAQRVSPSTADQRQMEFSSLCTRRSNVTRSERLLHADLEALDSIQLVDHVESYAHTAHHELVMLRFAECQPLQSGMSGIMCGRWPHLSNCTADSHALLRLTSSCNASRGSNLPSNGAPRPHWLRWQPSECHTANSDCVESDSDGGLLHHKSAGDMVAAPYSLWCPDAGPHHAHRIV